MAESVSGRRAVNAPGSEERSRVGRVSAESEKREWNREHYARLLHSQGAGFFQGRFFNCN